MSIKIYEAYRIPIERLNEFQDLVSKQVFIQTKKRIENFMSNDSLLDEFVNQSRRNDVSQASFMWEMFNYLIYNYFKPAKLDYLKSSFSIQSNMNIWIFENQVYIIPYFPFQFTLSSIILDLPDWVEEYAYWDNVDCPEHINYEEWEKRGWIWEDVCLNAWNQYRLSFEILDADCYEHMYKLEKTICQLD